MEKRISGLPFLLQCFRCAELGLGLCQPAGIVQRIRQSGSKRDSQKAVAAPVGKFHTLLRASDRLGQIANGPVKLAEISRRVRWWRSGGFPPRGSLGEGGGGVGEGAEMVIVPKAAARHSLADANSTAINGGARISRSSTDMV